jgi:hypothetical protein
MLGDRKVRDWVVGIVGMDSVMASSTDGNLIWYL